MRRHPTIKTTVSGPLRRLKILGEEHRNVGDDLLQSRAEDTLE